MASYAVECTGGSTLERVAGSAGSGHGWTLHGSPVSLEHSKSARALRQPYQAAHGVVLSRRYAQQLQSAAVGRFVGGSLVFNPFCILPSCRFVLSTPS